jgi:hypothetical protein
MPTNSTASHIATMLTALWGATIGGGASVARSAIGQDAAGDLIYAASMSAMPADLASVLASHGARIAMGAGHQPAMGPAGRRGQARSPANRRSGPGSGI